MSEVLGF